MNQSLISLRPSEVKRTLGHPPAKAARIVSAILAAVSEFELRTKQTTPSACVPFSVLFYEVEPHQVLFSLLCAQTPVVNCIYRPPSSNQGMGGLMRCDGAGQHVQASCSITRTLQPLIEQALRSLEAQVLEGCSDLDDAWCETWPIHPPQFETVV